MRRRNLLVALALCACLAAGAAPAEAKAIGFVAADEEPRYSKLLTGLRQGLREHGHGETRIHEYRVARGDRQRAEAAAEGLQHAGAAVAFVAGSELSRALRAAAPGLPIVFITPGDPVRAGLVASLARPGGMLTGMTFEYPELSAKRLELLREAAPGARRVAVYYDARDASPRQALEAVREAAGRLAIRLEEMPLGRAPAWKRGEIDGLLVLPGGAVARAAAQVIERAHAAGAPSTMSLATAPLDAALLAYGVDDAGVARESARLIDKILRGARPADLPVERPSRIELVVNLKAARALGISIPRTLLLRADRVIE